MQRVRTDENKVNEENEEKHVNSLIFKAIVDIKATEEKVRQISEYLDQGADINATDITNNNNTPLHVAAITGDKKIFEFLLNRGANYNIPNDDNHTITDIIESPGTPNSEDLSNIFYTKYGYTKRSGTSGLKGELYETKLLSLILVRALHNTNEFILGTNVKEMGALDDIVLRYKTNNMHKSKIIILQTKHRENEKWSAEYILNLIYEYYESYLQIRQKILTENNNILFEDSENENIECEFIIYTSAKEYVTKNKNMKSSILVEEQNTIEDDVLIKTSQNGRIFKFQCEKNYFDKLVTNFTESRIKTLGKTLAKFIFKNKFENIMSDDLTKTYHVFLAQNVIKKCHSRKIQLLFYIFGKYVAHTIATLKIPITILFAFSSRLHKGLYDSESQKIIIGQFQPNFFTSNDKNITLLKDVMCKEVAKLKKLTNHQQTDIENMMKALTFKLPKYFGNQYFNWNESKVLDRLNRLVSMLQNLFELDSHSDGMYIYIKIDDNSISTNKLLQRNDFKMCWLGGLVGNLLIHDNETDMLKINTNEESLANNNKFILQQIKMTYNPSIYRFDINIYGFPKLKLSIRKHDEKLVADFLSQFKVYTNQSQEDEVETILKDEIDKLLLKSKLAQINQHIRDTIFLKIHDKILKWRLHTKSPYLTRFYNFYDEALRDIFHSNSPLKNIHAICIRKFKNTSIKFENGAIIALDLDQLLHSNKRLMVIFSDEILFSSIKVYQFLSKIKQLHNYIFINLDSENIDNYLDILQEELDNSIVPAFIIISMLDNSVNNFHKIISIVEKAKSNIIVIAHNTLEDKVSINTEFIYRKDSSDFSSLSNLARKMILEERKVIFQGQKLFVNTILDEISLNLLSSKMLRHIIYEEDIIIGKELSNDLLSETVHYYVGRSLYRCIKLNTSDKIDDVCVIKQGSKRNRLPRAETNDIVFITKNDIIFEDVRTRVTKVTNNINFHWFVEKKFEEIIVQFNKKRNTFMPTRKYQNTLLWKQSLGSLQNIIKYVDRQLNGIEDEFTSMPETLKDIPERVVIISAESGMGKSTLITQLAINTKRLHPNLWIIRINLLDKNVLDQLNYWNENKIKINLVEAIGLLYNNISDNNMYNIHEVVKLIYVDDKDAIRLNKDNGQYGTSDIDLSEINLFNHFYNNNKLAILFDGFDEICPDYTKEVVQLLSILVNSRIAHLWVTSRPYSDLEQLECALGTFAYNLNPLNKSELRDYLQIVWHQRLGFDISLDSASLIRDFFASIKNNLTIDINFLSFPLHLYMFAEIYLNDLKEYIELKKKSVYSDTVESIKKPTNLTTFYEKFTTKKFDIQYGEKNSSMSSKDPIVKKVIENKRVEFFDIHKKLSVYYFLHKSSLLSKSDIEKVEEFVKNVSSGAEKIGIFERRVDKLTFIHKTFAEYFAAEFIFDKLKSDDLIIWKYLLNNILIHYDIGLRTFINSKLQSDQSILTYLMKNTKYMNIVFELLVAQFSKTHTNAIYLAIEADFEYIFMFLIECMKSVLISNKNKLKDFVKLINNTCGRFCIFCIARKLSKESIIKCLEDFITDTGCDEYLCWIAKLNQSQVLASYNQICVSLNSFRQDQKTIDIIVEFLADRRGSTHWTLGKYGFLTSFCFDYLLKLEEEQSLIPSFADLEGQNPSRYICKDNETDFELAVKTVLSKDKIENMGTSVDYTRLAYISFMLRNILKEVFNKTCDLTDPDQKHFVYNEFAKLRPDNFDLTLKVPPRHAFWQDIQFGKKLYEKKLLNLILIRALCDDNIKDFILANSVTGTYFGDIILRYKTNRTQETKMLFIHVLFPNTKKNWPRKTLNFERYLSDYLLFKQKFSISNEHEIICKGPMKNINCKFIIYNTAKEKYIRTQVVKSSDEENIIKTNKPDKLLQFTNEAIDDHVDLLVLIIVKLRAIELAKTLSMYIISNILHTGMINDELIRQYHVFLSQKVIQIKSKESSLVNHWTGEFRYDFLKSNEESLSYMKREICDRIAYQNRLTQEDAERYILSYTFNIPIQFCQPYFGYYGDEMLKQNEIDHLYSIFKKIFEKVPSLDSKSGEYDIIKLDDDSVGLGEVIQVTDLVGKNSLAKLVGTLLIIDDKNEMLRFNLNEDTLSPCNLAILRRLEQKYDIKRYRFDINVYRFPKLSLNSHDYDQKVAREFLSNLRFHDTKNMNIGRVDKVLKSEIHKYFTVEKKHHDVRFCVKCDEIFLTNLKYCYKYPGLYRQNIYNTTDLPSYAVPVPSTDNEKVASAIVKFRSKSSP